MRCFRQITSPRYLSSIVIIGSALHFGGVTYANEARKANLARVAVLRFHDRTGSANFRYLSTSLTEAIESSLRQKFEFVSAAKTQTNQANHQLSKGNGDFSAASAKKLQALSQSDILVFGYYTYARNGNALTVHTFIAVGENNYFHALSPVSNTVDATLFLAVDKVAANILTELAALARLQQDATGTTGKKGARKKTELTRALGQKRFNQFTWSVAGSIHGFARLPDQAGQAIDVMPGLRLGINRRMWRNIFASVELDYLPVRTEIGTAKTKLALDSFSIMPGAALALPVSTAWQLTFAANFGFFVGSFRKTPACASVGCAETTGFASNPVVSVHTSVNYLLSRSYALGLEGRWTLLTDSPQNLHLFAIGLRLQYLW